MADIRTIGICTGGGDCPGLNAVIRAATRSAIMQHGWRVVGIRDGFDGLIWPERTFELTLQAVSGILPRGGTILGTTNRGNPFAYEFEEAGKKVVRDVSDQVVNNARRMGIDAVIVVGGDGTQGIGLQLYKKGMPVVGVPKTIDNDLEATDFTFGFDTAVQTVTDAIDKLFSTAESHHRIMVVEVMGREAGWIALHGGIAGGAHVILVPEIPFTVKAVCDFIEQREWAGKKYTIVCVAEGIGIPDELKPRFEEEKRTHSRGGMVGNLIGDALGTCTKKDVRVTVLGHVQRGGTPSPFDRVLSTRFGAGAVELIAERKFGYMVALRGGNVASVSIEEACGKNKLVDPNSEIVRIAKATGICFGDESAVSAAG
ncbi:MAG TPA: ATP-dependent 6-phosphofructokinase [Terriglobales bacterium]|nr:ATP-dependent 6-phosphofructokinase [Terriglobales bacterium]